METMQNLETQQKEFTLLRSRMGLIPQSFSSARNIQKKKTTGVWDSDTPSI